MGQLGQPLDPKHIVRSNSNAKTRRLAVGRQLEKDSIMLRRKYVHILILSSLVSGQYFSDREYSVLMSQFLISAGRLLADSLNSNNLVQSQQNP
jgi:hypothetical protein